ncbi:hypothetical protein GCM10007420_22580 [Glycocaulis albus]|uniref:Flagellar basal-body/hook protein C-terminal domain-containing protein n=2 Tax=Glycocaulis albus TaxID=1382801 RepID=A0ABQ1XX90_9PROT|nr:hypothetical protein GCM10007420_22580 [Glycocaulis albus]
MDLRTAHAHPPFMNAAFASGVSGFASATALMNRAADRVSGVRDLTIPDRPSRAVTTPGAPAGPSPQHPAPGGRATPSPDYAAAAVDMIQAQNLAAASGAIVRAADDMVAALLDVTA